VIPVKWDATRKRIIRAGGNYLSIPQVDGTTHVYTNVNIENAPELARWIGSNGDLRKSFDGHDLTKKLSNSRGWKLMRPAPQGLLRLETTLQPKVINGADGKEKTISPQKQSCDILRRVWGNGCPPVGSLLYRRGMFEAGLYDPAIRPGRPLTKRA
jgi:hypothetical protein